jgi:hypothetical protein
VEVGVSIGLTLLRLHSGEAADWEKEAAALIETIPALASEGAHAEIAKAWRLVALVQQNGGRLGEAAQSIAKVVEHARLAGDQRLVARSALGLALSALYGPTPVSQAIEQCEALIAEDRGSAGTEPDRVQTQLRAMNGARRSARTTRARVLRDLGQVCGRRRRRSTWAWSNTSGPAAAECKCLTAGCSRRGETYLVNIWRLAA